MIEICDTCGEPITEINYPDVCYHCDSGICRRCNGEWKCCGFELEQSEKTENTEENRG